MNEILKAFCQYSNECKFDHGVEALRLFLPTTDGYINHNIVHSVMEESKCDTWRLSVVYYCDGDFKCVRPLTRSGAEWEMALKIKGRPDFIGGYAHGDEVFERTVLKLDGEEKEITSLETLTEFGTLSLEVWSVGYDPNDSITEALLHYKKIIADESGIKVEQRVEWLNDYELENSYMAMMPPLKSETDSYFTDLDSAIKEIPEKVSILETSKAKKLYLLGKSSFTFGLCAEKYLNGVDGANTYLISDNGGVPYNKMYFFLHHGGSVDTGEVWETVTRYTIGSN